MALMGGVALTMISNRAYTNVSIDVLHGVSLSFGCMTSVHAPNGVGLMVGFNVRALKIGSMKNSFVR